MNSFATEAGYTKLTASAEELDSIPAGAVSFDADGETFYYVAYDEKGASGRQHRGVGESRSDPAVSAAAGAG
ncbi:unnamed protein product [marine sediment metagenome]|uniref:Uncharacterized protein n=1 Tax=marine sediment metagenome TaxID=412755 RepID=X0VMK4_9ZZZZ